VSGVDRHKRTLTVRGTGPEGVLLSGDRAAVWEVGERLAHQDVVVLTVGEYLLLQRERDGLMGAAAAQAQHLLDARSLISWLAETVSIQQDAWRREDCPKAAREFIMCKVPRVQGTAINILLSRLADLDRDDASVVRALDRLRKQLPPARSR